MHLTIQYLQSEQLAQRSVLDDCTISAIAYNARLRVRRILSGRGDVAQAIVLSAFFSTGSLDLSALRLRMPRRNRATKPSRTEQGHVQTQHSRNIIVSYEVSKSATRITSILMMHSRSQNTVHRLSNPSAGFT